MGLILSAGCAAESELGDFAGDSASLRRLTASQYANSVWALFPRMERKPFYFPLELEVGGFVHNAAVTMASAVLADAQQLAAIDIAADVVEEPGMSMPTKFPS